METRTARLVFFNTFSFDREDEIAVLEIGMSERGQIEKLTNMIRPNVAVVT